MGEAYRTPDTAPRGQRASAWKARYPSQSPSPMPATWSTADQTLSLNSPPGSLPRGALRRHLPPSLRPPRRHRATLRSMRLLPGVEVGPERPVQPGRVAQREHQQRDPGRQVDQRADETRDPVLRVAGEQAVVDVGRCDGQEGPVRGPAWPRSSRRAGQVRKARAEAYRQTAAAAARLRLSAFPYRGTRTRASAASASAPGRPCASEPNSHAVGRRSSPRSASASRSVSPYGSAASTTSPAPRNSRSTAVGSAARTTSTWNRLPALARTHLPLYGSTASPAKTTAPAPAASAVRSTVPALPGSRVPARTATSRGRVTSASGSGRSRAAQTATSPCGVTVSASPARASSVTGEARPACATSSGWRASAAGVPNNSSTAPARSASRTAWGPSTRKRRVSSRSRRRSRRRAATTRGVRRVNGSAPGRRVSGNSGGLRAADALGCHRRAAHLDDRGERRLVGHREVSEDLAVHLHAGQLQALDEPVVRHPVGAGGRVDPGDPQLAEVALAVAPVPVGVLHRVQHLLLGLAVEP